MFPDVTFLSTPADEDDDAVAAHMGLANNSNPTCVSCSTVSSDSATRDTSISFAEMESEAMELSAGIAMMFSSLDMLKEKQNVD